MTSITEPCDSCGGLGVRFLKPSSITLPFMDDYVTCEKCRGDRFPKVRKYVTIPSIGSDSLRRRIEGEPDVESEWIVFGHDGEGEER